MWKFLNEFLDWIPPHLKGMIGFALGLALFMGTIQAIAHIPKFLKQVTETRCWDVKSVNNQYFKVNSCTGETVLLPVKETPK